MMNKISFLKWAVAALVVLNVGTIAFSFIQKRPPHRVDPQKVIIERLHFDAVQIADYEKLIEKHRNAVEQRQQSITAAKSELYQLLKSSDFAKKDSLVGRIGYLQEEIEQVHFAHFQEIKSLCKGSQVAEFDSLISELAQFFGQFRNNDRKEFLHGE